MRERRETLSSKRGIAPRTSRFVHAHLLSWIFFSSFKSPLGRGEVVLDDAGHRLTTRSYIYPR